MKLVLDTNVLISGIFWTGQPNQILIAWKSNRFKLVISPEILEEYRRVGEELSRKYNQIDINPIIDLILLSSEIVIPPKLRLSICRDPDDDKFITCALAAKAAVIVTGDKDLLVLNGYRKLDILKPRNFIQKYLKK